MRSSSRLPTRFPVGTKYVVEGRGLSVRRYVEFPNGRKVRLETRKALPCTCAELQQVSIARTRALRWRWTLHVDLTAPFANRDHFVLPAMFGSHEN